MRNILFYAIIIFMASCSGNSKKEVSNKEKVDSLRRDSIAKAKAITDSLELIAWGDTKFGMTKQEVMESKAFGGGQKENVNEKGWDSYSMNQEKRFIFEQQNGLRELMYITAHFEENELFKVTLKSLERDASHLDDITHDCYTIIEQFAKRYKNPMKLKEGVSILDLNENPKLMIAQFVIGKKGIMVNLYRNEHEYNYEIDIFNFSFPKKKHEPTKEEIEQQKKADELRNEVRDNSF